MDEEETGYFSRDFDWEQHSVDVEKDVSLQYHLVPFEESEELSRTTPSSSSSSGSPSLASSVDCISEAWKRFHNRHSMGRFFKERRYLLKEFPELLRAFDYSKVLEVGCGNGSTVLPILRGRRKIIVYACDCSVLALQRAEEMVSSSGDISTDNQFHPFLCDFSLDGFPQWLVHDTAIEEKRNNMLPCIDIIRGSNKHDNANSNKQTVDKVQPSIGGVDFVTLVFTLSSIPFQRMPFVIKECLYALKPGGLLLFRDYGLYDMTMLRFLPAQRIGYRSYMRSDGTLSYFFSLQQARELFCNAGFITLELEFCCVRLLNRRNCKNMQRVWIHGKFQKSI